MKTEAEKKLTSDLDSWSGKTSPELLPQTAAEDFRAVLEETVRIADENALIPRPANGGGWHTSGCIMGNGYSIAWRVLDAQFWGVPQRRRRIALVAGFGGQAHPKYSLSAKACRGILRRAERREKVLPTVLRIALESQIAAESQVK